MTDLARYWYTDGARLTEHPFISLSDREICMSAIQNLRSVTPVVLLYLTCAAGSPASAQEKPVPNELPRSWSLKEIAKETPPYRAEGRVYVLAWKVVEDERPLRVESCLALRVLDENKSYCLAHLYRHPAQKKPQWQLGMTHVTGKEGTKYFPGLDIMHVKRFKSRPSNKELYAALAFEEVNWSFEFPEGWKLVGCGVCEKSWQEAIGEKPSRFFGRADKKDKPEKPDLTPERAREALLRMMRSKEGKALGWFKGNIPDEMAKMKIEKKEDGWYEWTAAYRFNPSRAVYSFTVRPRPGARTCIFEYNGTFLHKDGQWTATPPKLVRTILQSGGAAN
jgi:hypothetical protein